MMIQASGIPADATHVSWGEGTHIVKSATVTTRVVQYHKSKRAAVLAYNSISTRHPEVTQYGWVYISRRERKFGIIT